MAAIYDKALKRRDLSGTVAASAKPATAGESDVTTKKGKKGSKGKAEEKSKPQEAGADVGKIVNLMSGDANRIAAFVSSGYFIYGSVSSRTTPTRPSLFAHSLPLARHLKSLSRVLSYISQDSSWFCFFMPLLKARSQVDGLGRIRWILRIGDRFTCQSLFIQTRSQGIYPPHVHLTPTRSITPPLK